MGAASTDPGTDPDAAGIGIVVIGRNEGDRLRRCLHSLGSLVRRTVYVDSGSQDDSVAFARGLGARVVELDTSIPFTAARARNEGLRALDADGGCPEFVQFVDGDCEIEAGWLARAVAAMRAEPDLAVVFGRRRERARAASPYNRLCDLEWDVTAGHVLSCGGDALMRAQPLRDVQGYDARLIAGEEPDLCLRLRSRGWHIRCIDAPMTVHDAAMHRFGQWWRRAKRAGYVEAEGFARHGLGYPRWRSAASSVCWAVGLPVTALATAGWRLTAGDVGTAVVCGAVALALYGVLWLRILRNGLSRWPAADARLHATFCLLGKWPAVSGMITFAWRRLTRGPTQLIEYKSVAATPPEAAIGPVRPSTRRGQD